MHECATTSFTTHVANSCSGQIWLLHGFDVMDGSMIPRGMERESVRLSLAYHCLLAVQALKRVVDCATLAH
jgi:hypothetical protein